MLDFKGLSGSDGEATNDERVVGNEAASVGVDAGSKEEDGCTSNIVESCLMAATVVAGADDEAVVDSCSENELVGGEGTDSLRVGLLVVEVAGAPSPKNEVASVGVLGFDIAEADIRIVVSTASGW